MAMMQVKKWNGDWVDIGDLPSGGFIEYRIKPEKKPDVVREVEARIDCTFDRHIDNGRNLRLTFSGETGELIKAEVIK